MADSPEPRSFYPSPPDAFDVECGFGITGCESEASERCGYAGFHVLGSYRTQGAFGIPYYYVKAACGQLPGLHAAPAEQPSPPRFGARYQDEFEVECRFGISGCESQVSERCGYAGYQVLGSYRAQGAFGMPYYYMKAACRAPSGTKPSGHPPQASVATPTELKPGEPSTGSKDEAAATWENARLEMTAVSTAPKGDPFEKSSSSDGKAPVSYEKAAQDGDATAQNNLGVLYDTGGIVARDRAKAVYWYRKAAEQGAATAQYNLAVMYHVGLGVPKDDEQAAAWCKKAAAQGQGNAQALLGRLYQRGEGVERDSVLAYAWFNLGAAAESEQAARARDEMNLAAQEVQEAQHLSSSWQRGELLRRQRPQKKDRAQKE